MADNQRDSLDDEAFEAAVNAEVEARGHKFGPVRIRRHDVSHPKAEGGWMAVDANGRRSRLSHDVDAERAVNVLHDRHKHRVTLDREIDQARKAIEDLLGDLAHGRVEAAYRDSLDGKQNSFLIVEVETTLLTSALRLARHRIDYRPYCNKGTNLVETRQVQRKRANRLGDRDRIDALTCCPVLAAAIGEGDRSEWRSMIGRALEDAAGRKDPHFVDGILMHGMELAQGVWWAGGELRIGRLLPQTIVSALPGMPLSAVIDHPWLPGGTPISYARIKGRSMQVRVPWTPLPMRDVLAAMR